MSAPRSTRARGCADANGLPRVRPPARTPVLLLAGLAQLTGATLAAITAASKLGSVSLLVAGDSADAVAQAASQVAGVSKVLVAKDAAYNNGLPENYANLVASVQKKGNFNYVVAAHTAFGKNFMPRLSAQLDAAQVSDVMAVEGPDTFVRPIYAGNAIATVKTADPVKVLTVRPTSFDKAATTGGSAAVESVPAADKFGTAGSGLEAGRHTEPAANAARARARERGAASARAAHRGLDLQGRRADQVGPAVARLGQPHHRRWPRHEERRELQAALRPGRQDQRRRRCLARRRRRWLCAERPPGTAGVLCACGARLRAGRALIVFRGRHCR